MVRPGALTLGPFRIEREAGQATVEDTAQPLVPRPSQDAPAFIPRTPGAPGVATRAEAFYLSPA